MNHYEFLDNASVGKSYDWCSLNIDLDFNKADVDVGALINGEREFGNSWNEAIFIHEYIHYLQSFYTNWGALAFCQYALALEHLGASKLDDNSQLELPLKIEHKPGSEKWNQGVDYYVKFTEMIGGLNDSVIHEKIGKYPYYSVKALSESSVIINNGLISYEVNNKTVREHAAELSCLLFLNYSDQQIHDRFLKEKSLCSTNGNLDKKPMYWILFEYFYFHHYTSIAEGLVYLCQGALCESTPSVMICRFFTFLENNPDPSESTKDLFAMARWFLDTPDELTVTTLVAHESNKALHRQLSLCSSHTDHDFYNFSSTIFITLMLNLKNFGSAFQIFKNPMALRTKHFWKSLVQMTGTPIMRYKDKSPVITSNNSELITSLTYFLGISKTFQNLQDSTKFACPFHSEFKICKADYRNDDNCFHDPVKVRNPQENGGECLFQNAIILLGFENRIK